MTDVPRFRDIETQFIERVHRVVWCNMATIDRQGRPRSRIMHTIWEGAAGWTATRRTSFKNRHLADNPYVSLAYIGDTTRPIYADCHAAWADALTTTQHDVRNLFATAPKPVGYDPTPVFIAADHPSFGVLAADTLADRGGQRVAAQLTRLAAGLTHFSRISSPTVSGDMSRGGGGAPGEPVLN